MAYDPSLSYSHKSSKSKAMHRRAFGCRRLYIYIALLFIVVAILIAIRLLSQMRKSFENFHYASDTDFELVTLPKTFAFERKARCLDGSPPAYYFRPGEVTSKSWILHLLPGAWCENEKKCYERSLTQKGSSKKAPASMTLNGLFSRDCMYNPQFCSWNVAVFLYCDGSSFLGNVSSPLIYNSKELYMRGAQNFDAILDYLMLSTGLKTAEQVLLTGSSAGGTGALIHADRLRSKLPLSVHSLHVVLDGSMFVDVPDINGNPTMANLFHSIYDFHGIKDAESIQECTKTLSTDAGWKCLFVSTYHSFVFTPVFFINSAFDTWLRYHGLRIPCMKDTCLGEHLETVYQSRDAVYQLAKTVTQSEKNGVFLSYCPAHCLMYQLTYFQLQMGQSYMRDSFALWLLHNRSEEIVPSPITIFDGKKTCVASFG